MSDPRRWLTLTSETLLDRWWMRLRADRVQLPTGAVIEEFHVAEYPDWALVLPVTSDGRVVMVEQYRYGIDRTGLEFAAGMIGEGEEPLVAAKRELLEETGYEADDWVTLGRLAVEPSRHTNFGHLFVARGARRVAEPVLDDTEDLSVHLIPGASLPELVRQGRLVHGIHAAALFWAQSEGLIA